jgi:hypothetical protein
MHGLRQGIPWNPDTSMDPVSQVMPPDPEAGLSEALHAVKAGMPGLGMAIGIQVQR